MSLTHVTIRVEHGPIFSAEKALLMKHSRFCAARFDPTWSISRGDTICLLESDHASCVTVNIFLQCMKELELDVSSVDNAQEEDQTNESSDSVTYEDDTVETAFTGCEDFRDLFEAWYLADFLGSSSVANLIVEEIADRANDREDDEESDDFSLDLFIEYYSSANASSSSHATLRRLLVSMLVGSPEFQDATTRAAFVDELQEKMGNDLVHILMTEMLKQHSETVNLVRRTAKRLRPLLDGTGEQTLATLQANGGPRVDAARFLSTW